VTNRWRILLGAGVVAAAMSGMAIAPAAVAAPADDDSTVAAVSGESASVSGGPAAVKPTKSKGPRSERDTPTAGSGSESDGDAPGGDSVGSGGDESTADDDVESGAAGADGDTDLAPEVVNSRGNVSKHKSDNAIDEVEDVAEPIADGGGVAPGAVAGTVAHPVTAGAPVAPAATPGVAAADKTEAPVAARSDDDTTDAGLVTASASVSLSEGQAEKPTRPATLLNVLGSLILNALGGLVHLIDGPPMLPANSTVTVRTSSLNLPIGAGRSVQADWYFPEDVDESTRLVYLQHGFLASGPMYSFTAARIAEQTHSIVVAPSLSSNFFAPDAAWVGGSTLHRAVAQLFEGNREALTQSASEAAGYAITLPQRFALVGHSAGGTLVTSVAGHLADSGAIDDLVGVVLLDGVEPAGSHFVSDALAKLRGENDVPIRLISSERYFWSRGGDVADKLALARPDRFNGVGLTGGLHIDYAESGNPIIQFAEYLVAGFSQPRNVAAAGAISVGWLNDMFANTTSEGIYGAPGEVIPVVTSSGTATATVLPLGQPSRPVWPPLLDSILTAIFDFGGRYLFVYDPLRGYETQALTSVA